MKGSFHSRSMSPDLVSVGEMTQKSTNQVGVYIFVDLEADGDTFGSGDVIYIGYMRHTSADGKASYHWSRGFVKMRSYGKRLGSLRWCECPFHEKAFGVG